MLTCWHNKPGARLDFMQLKYKFKAIIDASNPRASYTSQDSIAQESLKNLDLERQEDLSCSSDALADPVIPSI